MSDTKTKPLNELLKLQHSLLGDGRIEGMDDRVAQAGILQECILHRANELLILVQDSLITELRPIRI